jgi:hypothetical protein
MWRSSSVAGSLLGLVSLVTLLLAAPTHAQTLGAATTIAAGTNPTSVAIGDVNRDGRSDLVVTNGTPGTISVLLATGDGTFGAPTSFTVGAGPAAVALGDLNRDGILDAVVANLTGGSISVLLGNASGGFGTATTIPVCGDPTAVAIGDLDGDGRPDVVVGCRLAGTVSVLLGTGTGALSLVGDFATGPAPSSVVVADVNTDGVLDVIVGSRDGGVVSVLLGVGGGVLGPRLDLIAGNSIVGVAVADFNRDGRPDIAVADGLGGPISVQLSDRAGGFQRSATGIAAQAVAAVAVADLDGDGRDDIVVTLAAGTIGVLRATGNGTFVLGASVLQSLTTIAVAVGDFDRDGLPDVVTVHPTANVVSVRLNTTTPAPAGAFGVPAVVLLSSNPSDAGLLALLVGDVASTGSSGFDGGPDALVVDTEEVSVSVGSGPGLFPISSFPTGGATAAVLADLNRDGRPDLVLGLATRRIGVRLGTPPGLAGSSLGGRFGPPIVSNATSSVTPTTLAAGDLDRDGVADLVVGGDGGFVLALRGIGTGGFVLSRFLNLPTNSAPSAIALADVDRDGDLDLVVAHGAGISVFVNDGAGSFNTRNDVAAGLSPLDLAVGDVNRDGRLDLVFSDASDGQVRLMLGNGAGSFGAPSAVTGFTAASAVGLADLNRDGVLDLVVLDGGTGTVTVRPGAGNGTFGAPSTVPAGPSPAAFAVTDVDQDGRLDLLVVSTDRQLRALLNGGAGAGSIAFSDIFDTAVVEGSGDSTTVTITRAGGTAPVTVNLTLTGTAVLGVDYQLRPDGEFVSLPAASTLTFAQGEARKTLFLSTDSFLSDALVSANRTVVLTLSNPGGGAVLGAPTQRTITLTERDEALSFSDPVYPLTEGGQATVTVRRRGDLQGTVTVGFKAVAGSAAGADFTSTTGTLTFPPGVATRTFTVTTKTDSAREGDETVALTLTAPKSTISSRRVQLESPGVAELLVLDGNGATVGFASPTATVAEGSTINVTLTRAGALAETVTATVEASLFSASAGDFTLTPAAPATIVFAPGVTTQSIQIAATPDALAEGPETFALLITSVISGGRPGRLGSTSTLRVTIADDEAAFAFTDIPGRQIPESATSVTFTVMRTGPLTGTATVEVRTVEGPGGAAVPGQDYQPVGPTTLTFPPGMATRTFSVPLLNDTVVDGPKGLQVSLASPTGGPVIGTQRSTAVTLLDDDEGGVLQWQKAASTVSESSGTAVLTVTRTLTTPGNKLAGGVTVNVATTGGTATLGTDFTAPGGSLTFAAGQATQSVSVPIAADTIDEVDETVALTLSSPQGGAVLGPLSTTVLTITDDDEGGQIQFAAASATVGEDTPGTFAIRLVRTGKSLASAVSVNLAVTGGTAQAGVDFSLPTGTLTFAAGESMKDLALVRSSDGLAEGPETIILALDTPTGRAALGAQRTMVVTLTGVESAVGFSLPAFAVTEGTATAMLTVLRTGPLASAATVQVRTLDAPGGGSRAVPGVDYVPVPLTTLTFPPGMASRTVAVSILNNTRRDGPRTVALGLSNPGPGLALGTQRTTVLSIADNDAGGTIGFPTSTVTVSDAAGVATLTVTRTGTALAGGVSVDYIATFFDQNNSLFQRRLSGTVVFGPGQTSRTIVLPLSTDPLVRGERAFVQLVNPGGGATLGRAVTLINVTDKDSGGVIRFTTSTLTAVESSTVVLTVTRSGGMAGGVSVPFFVTDGSVGGFSARQGLDFLLTSGVVFFDEGETSQTIAIPILSDALLEGPESFQVSLSTPSSGATLGTPSRVLVTILDNEAVVGFERGFVNAEETTPSVTVTVLRSGPLTAPATVQFRTVEGTGSGNAVPDVDYRPVQKTLTFAPGVATQTVTIQLLNDTTVDGQRTVRLELGNPTGLALGTGQRSMSIVIADNDFGGTIQFADSQFVASEAAGVATLRVVRSPNQVLGPNAPGLGGGVVVSFTVTAQSASPADVGVSSGTVTFGAGETFKDIAIPIVNDGVSEGPESLLVTLQSATGGAFLGSLREATVTIID